MNEAIAALLAVARSRNRAMNVTGALVFNDGCFAQILEGGREELNHLFSAIQADPRHCNVTLLQRGPVAERAFGDWAMSYIETEPVRPLPGAALRDTLFQRLATVVHGGA